MHGEAFRARMFVHSIKIRPALTKVAQHWRMEMHKDIGVSLPVEPDVHSNSDGPFLRKEKKSSALAFQQPDTQAAHGVLIFFFSSHINCVHRNA